MGIYAVRSFNTNVGEASQIRDVSEKMLLLEEDRTPLYVLTNNSQRKVSTKSPRIEWFEDADLVMLAASGTVALSSVATGLFVADVTLYGVNDVIQIKGSSQATTVQEELALVTAITGTTNGTLTLTRAFASTTADTISSGGTIKILYTCQTENGSIDTARSSSKSNKTSGAQIFEWPISITRTGQANQVYGVSSERAHQQMMGMRRQKIEIENAGLFGKFSESLASPGSRWSSMGVRSIISTNLTDASTTLTYQGFLSHSRTAFRYGVPEKLLIAAPIVKEALDYFCANKQLSNAEDKVFGVSLKRFVTSNGTWVLANNYNMDGGESDEAIGVDLPSVEFCPLVNNGENLDTKIYQDYDKTNPKLIKDLVATQAGWRVRHEARHSRLYDVSAYA